MISFEITRSKVERPTRCTIRGAYSGSRCPSAGEVALEVVAVFDNERGREPFRNFRICTADADSFIAGFAESAPTELIDR